MALSVVQRPKGFIIGTTSVAATYTKGSSVITSVAHGLSTGKIIYITEQMKTSCSTNIRGRNSFRSMEKPSRRQSNANFSSLCRVLREAF